MRRFLSYRRLVCSMLAAVCGWAVWSTPVGAAPATGQAEIVTAPKSGYLLITGDRIAISGALELDPCEERLSVSITPTVKVPGLGGLKGTVRAGGDIPAGVETATHYLVEGKMTVRDGGSHVVGENLTGFLAASGAKPETETTVEKMNGKLALDWDGTRWSAEGLSVAQTGGYTADTEVVLLRTITQTKNAKLLREEVLDRAVIRTTFQLSAKVDECRTWAQAAPGLGKGPDHQVLVHGLPAVDRPWISWRHNRPVAIFGDMGHPASLNSPRLTTVKKFLNDHLNLFGILDARVVNTLSQDSENQDPDGTVRLRLSQSSTVGAASVRAEKAAMTAVFDSTNEMVFLSGRFLENLPLNVAAGSLTSNKAVDLVLADLQAKGMDAGRAITYLNRVVFGDGSGLYELAFRAGVGAADRRASTRPVEERNRTLEYWISAGSGRVLRIRERTSSSQRPVVTVFDTDPGLVFGTGGAVDSGIDGAIDRAAEIRINDPTGNIFLHDRWWLEDDDASSGVVSQTFIDDPYDEEPRWYTPDLDGTAPDMGGNGLATQREKRKAFTAYRQIQMFWERFGNPFVPGLFQQDIDLLVQVSDMDPSLGGQYQPLWFADNEIRLSTDWLEVSLSSIPLYAAAHEAFHHLDWHTTDLEGADGDDDRMPGAIKEGMASAAMDWTDPHRLSNVQATGASLFACLFGSGGNAAKFRTCLDLATKIFRKAGANPFMRPWSPSSVPRNPLLPWPDCRTIDPMVTSPGGCFLVLLPDQSTTTSFKWGGQTNDPQSQYFLVQQTMFDLWETMSSVAAAGGTPADGQRFADNFPFMAIKAFLMLDDEASLVDLRNALRAASSMAAMMSPFSPDIVAAVDETFARHGIDAQLVGFCDEEANEDLCH